MVSLQFDPLKSYNSTHWLTKKLSVALVHEKNFRDLGSGFEEMNDYFVRFPHLIEWTSPTNERTEPKPHNTSTVWVALKLSPNCRINKNPTGNISRPITDIVYILLFYIFSFVISLINLFTNCSKL